MTKTIRYKLHSCELSLIRNDIFVTGEDRMVHGSSEDSESTRSSRSWSQGSRSSAGPIDQSGTKRKKRRSSGGGKKGRSKKSRRQDKAARWTSSDEYSDEASGGGRSDEDRGRSRYGHYQVLK